jgi:hypothetical protein
MANNLSRKTYLTCPFCGFREKLAIPDNYCLILHRCANCNMRIRPAPGDCCIFCTHGDALCLAEQKERTHAFYE